MVDIEPVANPQVHTHGEVPPEATEYAVGKVQAALHHAPGPVLRTSLTLDSAAPGDRVDQHGDLPGRGPPAEFHGDVTAGRRVAQGVVDQGGEDPPQGRLPSAHQRGLVGIGDQAELDVLAAGPVTGGREHTGGQHPEVDL